MCGEKRSGLYRDDPCQSTGEVVHHLSILSGPCLYFGLMVHSGVAGSCLSSLMLGSPWVQRIVAGVGVQYLKEGSAAPGSVTGLRLPPPIFWEALGEGLTQCHTVFYLAEG